MAPNLCPHRLAYAVIAKPTRRPGNNASLAIAVGAGRAPDLVRTAIDCGESDVWVTSSVGAGRHRRFVVKTHLV